MEDSLEVAINEVAEPDAEPEDVDADLDDDSGASVAEGCKAYAAFAEDKELHQKLVAATSASDFESLLVITEMHLEELGSVSAAFALAQAAKMLEAPSSHPKIQNLISCVSSLVLAEDERCRSSACSPSEDSLDDGNSEAVTDMSTVQDQGLHIAWTISTTCRALGLLGHKDAELLAALARLAEPLLPQFTSSQLQNTIGAFALLGLPEPKQIFEAVVETVVLRVHEFSNRSLVAILHAFATVQIFNTKLFEACAEVLVVCNGMRNKDLVNCSWAFAVARIQSPSLFEGLGNTVQHRIPQFRPQEASLMAWSFATVSCRHEAFFQAIQNHVVERCAEYPLDSMANVLHGFAIIGHPGCSKLLESKAISHTLQTQISQIKSQALAKLLLAMSKTKGSANVELVECFAAECLLRLESMSTSLITAIIMSFSKVRFNKRNWFMQAAEKICGQLELFETSSFLRLLKSFLAANAVTVTFADAVTNEAIRRLPDFNSSELVSLSKFYLSIKHASPELLEHLASRGTNLLSGMSQKELVIFIRSLSSLGVTASSESGRAIFIQAARQALSFLQPQERNTAMKPSELACLARELARATSGSAAFSDEALGLQPDSTLLAAISQFLDAAVKEACDRLDEFRSSPGSLVGVLWGASQCRILCDKLVQAAVTVLLPPDAGGCDSNLGKLGLQELAELAQALTTLNVTRAELYRAIADVAATCLQGGDAAGVLRSAGDVAAADTSAEAQLVAAAKLLRFLATAGLLAPVLAVRTAERALKHMTVPDKGGMLPAWALACCLASLAIADSDPKIALALKALAKAASARLRELLPQERALILWSLSMQGCYEEIFDAALEQTPWSVWAPQSGEAAKMKLGALQQVHFADLALQLEGGGGRRGLPPDQRKFVLQASQSASLHRGQGTLWAAEAQTISQALASMDLLPSLGCHTPEGLALGIKVSSQNSRGSSSKLSIEVDRPGDFLLDVSSGRAHRFLPMTLRRRLLWRLGHTVIVIPWFEIADASEQQLVGLLRAKLSAVKPVRSLQLPEQRGLRPPLVSPGQGTLATVPADTGSFLVGRAGRAESASSVASASASSSSDCDGAFGADPLVQGMPAWLHTSIRPPPGLG